MPDTTIRAFVCDGKVVLELPVDVLTFACKNNPAGFYQVRNTDEFAKWIAANIVEFDEDETGNSALFRLLDELFDEAAIEGVIDVVDVEEA